MGTDEQAAEFSPTHPPNLLVTVLNAHYCTHGREAESITSATERILGPREDVWRRTLPVGFDWQRLDFGDWLSDGPVSLFAIENQAGQFLQVQPSTEERAAIARQVVEISFGFGTVDDEAALLVHPGETFHGTPGKLDIHVRCQSGETRFALTVFPG